MELALEQNKHTDRLKERLAAHSASGAGCAHVLNQENKEIVLNGEEHSIAVLAGAFEDWLENISKHTKIYFGTYQRSENAIYQKTQLKKFMFPFLEGNDYPKASDKKHHGPEFNRDFAKILGDFLIS